MAKKKEAPQEEQPFSEWAGEAEITQEQLDHIALRQSQADLKQIVDALREHGSLKVA